MIARHRGEHYARETWRPNLGRAVGLSRPAEDVDHGAHDRDLPAPHRGHRLRKRWRQFALWLMLGAGVAVSYLAVNSSRADRAVPRLPPTPRAWLDAYEAAAIDNPSSVCSQLFAPELASLYARAAHGSCTRYFERIMSSSVTVRRIVRHGPTAVLELRQTLNRANWAVVLTRHGHGWQAVDLLGAALLR
jgi:hypothetical protein